MEVFLHLLYIEPYPIRSFEKHGQLGKFIRNFSLWWWCQVEALDQMDHCCLRAHKSKTCTWERKQVAS
jgi:hypothetical protein